MSTTPNIFYNTAHLYDMDTQGIGSADAHFILERAVGRTGPILELACGTGRITIPIAEAGHEIVGLDLSRRMLEILIQKKRGWMTRCKTVSKLSMPIWPTLIWGAPLRLSLSRFAAFRH